MDEGGMQLMDECSDLFIKLAELTDNQTNFQQRFQLVHSNVTEKSPIAILVNLVCQLLLTQWLLLFHITTFSETTSGCQCPYKVMTACWLHYFLGYKI